MLNNPQDEARLETLRRMADPRNGASANERAMAQKMADQLEADLRAKGWTPRPKPPSPSARSHAPEQDYGPFKTTEDFIDIPPAFLKYVKEDIRPSQWRGAGISRPGSNRGKGFGYLVGGTYMFVRARDLALLPQNYDIEWMGHVPRDGYLLVTIPPPQKVLEGHSPWITGFYTDGPKGVWSCGQYPDDLWLKGDGLYGGHGGMWKVFDIAPSDAAKLMRMGAAYQRVY
jgi:hypothetical protein